MDTEDVLHAIKTLPDPLHPSTQIAQRAAVEIKRRDDEIEKLREALRRYGDKFRMGTVYPESLQQAIDRAFGDTSTEI